MTFFPPETVGNLGKALLENFFQLLLIKMTFNKHVLCAWNL